jgi:hypothetical protein
VRIQPGRSIVETFGFGVSRSILSSRGGLQADEGSAVSCPVDKWHWYDHPVVPEGTRRRMHGPPSAHALALGQITFALRAETSWRIADGERRPFSPLQQCLHLLLANHGHLQLACLIQLRSRLFPRHHIIRLLADRPRDLPAGILDQLLRLVTAVTL